ncbi:hypothetical protein COHA_003052 [Chlorella ohadii]|uniref:E2F-associated phosphoprotein n=1 Tax=Chlorella ohadii TaxID=2649997 RepID=A0AAD5DUH4_9CHLO|nr:hypothetical protein COHA_003052 [Chlorella ohadii]
MDEDWAMSSDDESLGGASAVSDADAAALGLDTQPPEFYDPEADDKDEAWARRMRRSHRSDAILSCPLCFTTLCIDCQQHDTYDNQFRAMFVMNCRVKTGEVVTLPTPPPKRGKRQGKQRGAAAQQQAAAGQQQPQLPLGDPQQQQGSAPGSAAAQQQAAAGDSDQLPAAQHQAVEQPPLGPQAEGAAQAGGQAAAAAAAAAASGPPQAQQQAMPGPGGSGEEGPLNPVCCAVCDTEVGLRDAQDGVYHFFNIFASNS